MIAAVRETRPGDAEALLANVRPDDVRECEALFGADSLAGAVQTSVAMSVCLWTLTFDDEVGAIFGVTPVNFLTGIGAPWLIGTPLIDKNRGAFIRLCHTYIPAMNAAFPRLFNIVDARNVKSIAWLKRMGFEIRDPAPMGKAGEPFHMFTMEA